MRELPRPAFPVAVVPVGVMLMGMVDVTVGHVSPTDMAAVARTWSSARRSSSLPASPPVGAAGPNTPPDPGLPHAMDGRLALFPLPVVLLPEAHLPLHVFEARYRRMVARCLEFDRRFGVVYHDPDRMGPFLVEAGRVGCVALIEEFRPLPDGGRSLLLARGRARFRIRDGIESGEPFYEAVVEPYPDHAPPAAAELAAHRRRSLELFRRVLDALGEAPSDMPDLDVEREVSFRLAATLEIDPAWQQSLLELRSEVRRLHRLDAVFRAAARKLGEE